MGNYKFRLSDMMPNAWFYKLKDMSRTSKHYTSHSSKKKQASNAQKLNNSHPRQPLYLSSTESKRANRLHNSPVNPKASSVVTHFQESSPRKSFNKKRTKRKTIYRPSPRIVSSSSSVSAGCSCHASINAVWTNKSNLHIQDSSAHLLSALESSFESFLSNSDDDEDDYNFSPPCPPRPRSPPQYFGAQLASWTQSSGCKISSSTNDIIIDMSNDAYVTKFEEFDGFDPMSELQLPPILTKPAKVTHSSTQVKEFKKRSFSVEVVKEDEHVVKTLKQPKPPISAGRKSSSNPAAGIRLRVNSPKIQVSARKSLSSSSNASFKSRKKGITSDSFAMVKSSVDPQRDFKDSMVEMIVENNIRASKDLEDLLACYLSLNSNEYHDIIIKAFEQIWFDMTNLRL